MAEPTLVHPRWHGLGARGATLARESVLFEGPYGRLFRSLPPADFGESETQNLEALGRLANRMTAGAELPKDGPHPEEGGIPAAFTYFGQFVDHDLTFDPASSLQRHNDVEALRNFRSPRFDLDSVYGRGPADQPYLYQDGRSFLLGAPLHGAKLNPGACDLPRSRAAAPRAIIGDPRNDENVIVSQLHGLLLRFHNRLARERPWPFDRLQREVRHHYQWVVLHDLLPRIVSAAVLDELLPNRREAARTDRRDLLQARHPLLRWRNDPFIPLEFSAAAYRFGHSMVRAGYRLNETVPPLPIFSSDPEFSLAGLRPLPADWAIDWNLFLDLVPRSPLDATRMQLAFQIDTSLINGLGHLPAALGPPSLARRNLTRGWRMRLPSGQAVARALGLAPLADGNLRIGRPGRDGEGVPPIAEIHPAFADNCPLWAYVLAEAASEQALVRTTAGEDPRPTRRLGPVGGRIVAETFIGLLMGDSHAFLTLDPRWKPATLASKDQFGLRELIAFALD